MKTERLTQNSFIDNRIVLAIKDDSTIGHKIDTRDIFMKIWRRMGKLPRNCGTITKNNDIG